MRTFNVNLTHSDIWKDDSNEPITRHEIDGVTVEIDTDGGNWWIEDVIVDGLSFNSVDTLNPSNFEGPSEVHEELEKGTDIETAAEECGAEWMVKIGDYRYFFFPEQKNAKNVSDHLQILNEKSDFKFRVYEDGEVVVMFEGNDRSEQSVFAQIQEKENFNDYSDKPVLVDECGDKYVEMLNSELEIPFDESDIDMAIAYYQSFNN